MAAFLLSMLLAPPALPSDSQQADNATADAAAATKVEDAPATAVTDAAVTDAAVSDAAVSDAAEIEGKEPVTERATTATGSKEAADEWVCRKETPTGSHRSIKACRRRADIEANSAEVEKTMNRQRHYGNPSVTPPG